MCSTPFGIIGILTTQIGFVWPSMFVLNAFRHHRNSHTTTTKPSPTETGCAQRLSASSEFSPSLVLPTGAKQAVLNAFRHHRNSHRGGVAFLGRAHWCS